MKLRRYKYITIYPGDINDPVKVSRNIGISININKVNFPKKLKFFFNIMYKNNNPKDKYNNGNFS